MGQTQDEKQIYVPHVTTDSATKGKDLAPPGVSDKIQEGS